MCPYVVFLFIDGVVASVCVKQNDTPKMEKCPFLPTSCHIFRRTRRMTL